MEKEIFFYVITAALANILGSFFIFLKKNWSRRSLYALMALSSGLLFSIAIMDLVPEALEIMESSSIYIILGFGIIFFISTAGSTSFSFWRRNTSI